MAGASISNLTGTPFVYLEDERNQMIRPKIDTNITDFLQLAGIENRIRATRIDFQVKRKLPIDQRVQPEFKITPQMLKNISEEERQEKARLLKNRFVVRMAGFWNLELEKDKSDRHMPPDVHYERMVRRLNSNLRAWNRDDA